MAEVLLYVVIENRIYNYWFYSRELANINFGCEEIGVALIQNTLNKMIYPCLLRFVPNIYGPCKTKHLNYQLLGQPDKGGCNQEIDIVPRQCCAVAATEICPIYKSTFSVDAHVASCVITELQQSHTFRRRFLKYLKKKSPFKYKFLHSEGKFSEIFDGMLEVSYVVEICPLYPVQKIDFAWYIRLQGLLIKKIHLEDAMAWLSTLGGAYSSLGDYFESHAVMAGKISFTQLKLAMELADPLTIARCKLFFALSLMQIGNLEKSKSIIRQQLKLAKNMKVSDEKLIAMCRGLWTKLRYFKQCQIDSQSKDIKEHEMKTREKYVTDAYCVYDRNQMEIIMR